MSRLKVAVSRERRTQGLKGVHSLWFLIDELGCVLYEEKYAARYGEGRRGQKGAMLVVQYSTVQQYSTVVEYKSAV